jgi:hypothetical protein
MILSMAHWMRFVGLVKLVTSLITLFFVLVGLIFVGAQMGTGLPEMGKFGQLIRENLAVFFSLGLFALLLAIVGVWLGFLLYSAGEDFVRVAKTDEADQDYITAGLIQLKVYMKVSILLALATVLVAATVGGVFAISLAAART